MHARPEDPAILPPALRAEGDSLPFVDVTEFLARHELPVPTLYGVRRDERWVLLEDLGGVHLADLSQEERRPQHERAIDLLARVHDIPRQEGALPFRRRFDREWIGFELALFLEQIETKSLRSDLERAFADLASAIADLPVCLCLRDYQSHNLMIDQAGRLRVIDYQDALLAPAELDLAALLWDSYVDLGREERAALLLRYDQARGRERDGASLPLLVVQRKAKDVSRFQRLVDSGDARFAPALLRAGEAVREALPELPPAQRALAALLPVAFEELAA